MTSFSCDRIVLYVWLKRQRAYALEYKKRYFYGVYEHMVIKISDS